MNNLIDISYFVGERDIPNTISPAVSSLVNHMVKEYQQEFLEELMGYDMFELFEAGLLIDPVADIWIAIRDGAEFTALDGRVVRWGGLVNSTTLRSPLADYVYYYWLRQNQSHTSGTGEVKNKHQNAQLTSVTFKEAKVWNSMVEKNWKLVEMLNASTSIYPPYETHMGRPEQRRLLTKINAYNL